MKLKKNKIACAGETISIVSGNYDGGFFCRMFSHEAAYRPTQFRCTGIRLSEGLLSADA